MAINYKDIPGATDSIVAEIISAFTDEAYTQAKDITGTGIVTPNPEIYADGEGFVGQARWHKPIDANINVASLTDASEGNASTYEDELLNYVKTVRTVGMKNINIKNIITQQDRLAKMGRDLAEAISKDHMASLMGILKGIAISEALVGTGANGLGGQSFDNDPNNAHYGFYVDLGANKMISTASAANQGAQRAEAFLEAIGKAWKDYEPEYAYLVTSPEMMASLRSANLVDSDRIVEGNVEFDTIFNGKFRLIRTRASAQLSATELTNINAGSGIDIAGTKVSYIMLPGAINYADVTIPEPVGIDRNEGAHKGTGTTNVWYRWGYVYAPAGYDWIGSSKQFASVEDYSKIKKTADGTFAAISATADPAGYTGTWKSVTSSALTKRILPVFHS